MMSAAPRKRAWDQRETLVQLAWASIDVVLVWLASFTAAALRYDFTFRAIDFGDVILFALLSGTAYFAVGLAVGPYRIGHTRGSFEEIVDIARASALTMLALVLFVIALRVPHVPRSMPFTTPLVAMVLMCAVRFVVRTARWGGKPSLSGEPVIVWGVGPRGRQLIRTLLNEPNQRADHYVPVAAIDDDPRKRRLKVDGVKVWGSGEALVETAAATGATKVLVAIPQASADELLRIKELAGEAELDVLVLPRVMDIFEATDATEAMSGLRELQLEDLLGREPVHLDTASIERAVSGKRVLVTGAGGSIGAELCRQLSKFGPTKLTMLDRDESALHAAQMSLTGRALLDDGTLALADIRDTQGLKMIFDRERPQVVFHAAALKHLTLLEQFPLEAWKSNVLGTLNVLEASRAIGVETFVNISTDKAANPSCVLGYSKRCAERLTAAFAAYDDGTYVSVRFGNVLGSRGSVITAFTTQIERGGPVTVTHPDVERYFMLIPEACQLVLQAAAIGKDGEVMVLEMGQPVKIADMAQTLIDLSGKRDVTVEYTGLRPGEKLSEELFTPGEEVHTSAHPLVSHVSVPALDPASTSTTVPTDGGAAFDWMMRESGGHTSHPGFGSKHNPVGSDVLDTAPRPRDAEGGVNT